ncbi:MAG: hypothetical protein RLZZ242_1410, partial [Bacteroidota bacterium]
MKPNLYLLRVFVFVIIVFGLQSCSSGRLLTDVRPIGGDDLTAKKEALTDAQLKVWFMADPVRDSVAGISLERVKESMKPKKRSEVVVAIVDSGVDLNHPGFSGSLWQNLDELPENGIDDDNNGYIDDVNGYNFLGDSYYEQMEYVRMLARGIGSTADLERAKTIHSKEVVKAQEN